MVTLGVGAARAHFSKLVARLAVGEEVVITKRGKPVARLVRAENVDGARAIEAVEKLKALRKGTSLGDLALNELRDNGRP
jgi:prevent-host-death family protein